MEPLLSSSSEDLGLTPSGSNKDPYAGMFDGVGTSADDSYQAPKVGPTEYQKIQTAKQNADAAAANAQNFSTVGETIKGLPSSVVPGIKNAFDVAANVVKHPVETSKAIDKGFISGATLGGADWAMNKIAENKQALGLSDQGADNIKNFLNVPPEYQGVKNTFDVAGSVVPYVATDGLLSAGLKYAAPEFIAKHAALAHILSDVTGFNALGQTSQTFQSPEVQDRLGQAKMDTAMALAFPLGGAVYRGLRNTIFKGAKTMEPITQDATAHLGETPKDVPPATTAVTADTASGKPLTVATNNIDALQNTIHGSANLKIEVKPAVTLGEEKGVPVTARHFYNEKTGQHIIQVTDQADAATMAHEFGHAINDQLAGRVRGFSDYLTGNLVKDGVSEDTTAKMFKAQSKIEDTLSSFATKQLAEKSDTITSAMVNAQMSKDIAAMKSEIEALAKERPGRVKDTPSERFSDAVSVLTTHPTAPDVAPTLKAFLEHSKLYSDELKDVINSSFKKGMTSEIKIPKETGGASIAPEKPTPTIDRPDVVNVGGKQFQLKGAALERYKRESESFNKMKNSPFHRGSDEHAKFMHGQGMKLAATKRELTGQYTATELSNLIEREKSNYIGKKVLVEVNGKKVEATIASKPSSGKYQVALASDGSLLKGISKDAITDPRTKEQIIKEITTKSDAKLFEPKTEKTAAQKVQEKLNEANDKRLAEQNSKKKSDFEVSKGIEIGDKKSPDTVKFTSKDALIGGKEVERENTVHGKIISDEGGKIKMEIEHDGRKLIQTINKDNIVGKAPELDRTPTGKKPDSAAVRAELLTKDADQEVFINTKILPKVEGKYRIGKSNEDIINRAMDSDLTEEGFNNILKERFGNLSEDIMAGKNMMLDKAKELGEALNGKSIESFSPAEQKDLLDKWHQVVEMYEVFSGVRTELSNSFRTLGLTAMDSGENDVLRTIFESMKTALNGETDPFKIAQKLTQTGRLTKWQKFTKGSLETWYSAILSGPKTHARNILSNLSNVATELASKASNPMTWSEVGPSIKGMGQAMKEEWPNFKKELMKTIKLQQENLPQDASKFGFDKVNPVEDRVWGKEGKLHRYGQLVESVGHILMAEDTLFASAARGMEEASLKVYAPKMSAEVQKAVSTYFAEQTVYHGMPKGDFMRGLVRSAEALRKEFPASKLIIPFVKTVGNVLDRQFDYIPLLNMARLTEKNLGRRVEEIAKTIGKEVTPDEKKLIYKRLRDQQMGRMYLGLGITAGAVAMAKDGRLSGSGPTNNSQKTALENTGWRANSIKIGDTWVPYLYLGPLGGVLSVAGNIHDKTVYDAAPNKNVADLMFKGILGWTQSQLNQSFLSGASNLMDVVNGQMDPKKYFDNFAAGLVPIPALWSQSKDIAGDVMSHITGDPSTNYVYQTSGIVDQIRTKLGLTGDVFGKGSALNPRLDAFGRPMTGDLIYGLTPSPAEKRVSYRVDNFLAANDMYVTIPNKLTQYADPFTNTKRPLTKDEYQQYVTESGKEIYTQLDNGIPAMAQMDPKEREAYKRSIVISARKDARERIMMNNRNTKTKDKSIGEIINNL